MYEIALAHLQSPAHVCRWQPQREAARPVAGNILLPASSWNANLWPAATVTLIG